LSYLAVQRIMIIPDCMENVNRFYRDQGAGSRKRRSEYGKQVRGNQNQCLLIIWPIFCRRSSTVPASCYPSLYQPIRFSDFFKNPQNLLQLCLAVSCHITRAQQLPSRRSCRRNHRVNKNAVFH